MASCQEAYFLFGPAIDAAAAADARTTWRAAGALGRWLDGQFHAGRRCPLALAMNDLLADVPANNDEIYAPVVRPLWIAVQAYAAAHALRVHDDATAHLFRSLFKAVRAAVETQERFPGCVLLHPLGTWHTSACTSDTYRAAAQLERLAAGVYAYAELPHAVLRSVSAETAAIAAAVRCPSMRLKLEPLSAHVRARRSAYSVVADLVHAATAIRNDIDRALDNSELELYVLQDSSRA